MYKTFLFKTHCLIQFCLDSLETEGLAESEEAIAARFLREESLGNIINTCLDPNDASRTVAASSKAELDSLLMPPPAITPVRTSPANAARNSIISPGMGLRNTVEDYFNIPTKDSKETEGETR